MADLFTSIVSIQVFLPRVQASGQALQVPGTVSTLIQNTTAVIRGTGVKTK